MDHRLLLKAAFMVLLAVQAVPTGAAPHETIYAECSSGITRFRSEPGVVLARLTETVYPEYQDGTNTVREENAQFNYQQKAWVWINCNPSVVSIKYRVSFDATIDVIQQTVGVFSRVSKEKLTTLVRRACGSRPGPSTGHPEFVGTPFWPAFSATCTDELETADIIVEIGIWDPEGGL
jgi:hypothetical protein